MIKNKKPLNNEAGSIDEWNYNRGWNDAMDEKELVYPDDRLVDNVVAFTLDIQAQLTEKQIQDKLISLGWMPPEEVKSNNEIREGMKCLMKELVSDIKNLEHELTSLRQEIKRSYFRGWHDSERNLRININRPLRESELE